MNRLSFFSSPVWKKMGMVIAVYVHISSNCLVCIRIYMATYKTLYPELLCIYICMPKIIRCTRCNFGVHTYIHGNSGYNVL